MRTASLVKCAIVFMLTGAGFIFASTFPYSNHNYELDATLSTVANAFSAASSILWMIAYRRERDR